MLFLFLNAFFEFCRDFGANVKKNFANVFFICIFAASIAFAPSARVSAGRKNRKPGVNPAQFPLL